MNYDLLTWVEYFVGAFACCFGMFLSGKILLERKFSEIKWYKYLLIILVSIFSIFNSLVFDNILKLFGSLIVFFVIFKFIFEEKSVNVFVYSMITYVILMLSEIVYVFGVSLFDYIFNFSFADSITKTIYTNVIIALIASTVIYLLRNSIMSFISKMNKVNLVAIFLQGLLTIIVIISSINYLYIDNWQFSYKFLLITAIIIGSSFLTISLVKQYLKNKEVVEKHQMLEEYLKTSTELIEKYSSTNHKFKNNLIALKGYIETDIDEANRYVDSLLDNMKNKKYRWVSKINNIPINTIRYLINYKLSKSEELNLKIVVNVSEEIKEIDKNILTQHDLGIILEILGEYFDNANYACNESDLKELNFDLYLDGSKLVFLLANTYKEEMDLNSLNKNGYTTKGKGHGFGLYDVDKTIKDMKFLSSKYEKFDNYFMVTFTVDLAEIKK